MHYEYTASAKQAVFKFISVHKWHRNQIWWINEKNKLA